LIPLVAPAASRSPPPVVIGASTTRSRRRSPADAGSRRNLPIAAPDTDATARTLASRSAAAAPRLGRLALRPVQVAELGLGQAARR